MSSSNFVHGCCHAFTPGRVASIANSKALLLGGEFWLVVVLQETTQNNTLPEATFGPTLVVAFITKKISLFLCGGGLGWKSETKKGWFASMKQNILPQQNCAKWFESISSCGRSAAWTDHKKPCGKFGQTQPSVTLKYQQIPPANNDNEIPSKVVRGKLKIGNYLGIFSTWGGRLVNCPTRWSLLFIFGFLYFTSI